MQNIIPKPKYKVSAISNTYLQASAHLNNASICNAKISTNDDHNEWTITAWYTNEAFKNQGIGKKTLGTLIETLFQIYGQPKKIDYIWNGQNEYVYEWMARHFDAVCNCPLVVQKMQAEDDWLSHIYTLNVSKVLDYFGLV